MRRVAVSLAALALLGVTSDKALAKGALSYPMAAHVAAKYGVQHPGHSREVIQAVKHYRHPGKHGYHHYPRPPYRRAPVVVYPRVWRYPAVVVPAPRPYYPRPYYYLPYSGFQYSGPGGSFSIGW